MTPQTIPINTIDSWDLFYRPGALDPRTPRDTARIELYKKAIRLGRTPPALVVAEVDGKSRILLAGRHTIVAFRELGLSAVPAEIHHVATPGMALRLGLEVFGPASLCRAKCEEFLRQEERQAMASQQTIPIDSIDEDRRYWRMVIRAIGCENPKRDRPGHVPRLIAKYAQTLRQGASLQPITVIQAGEKRFLYDGHHRLSAHKECGRTEISAVVYEEKDFLALLPYLSRMPWLRLGAWCVEYSEDELP